MKTLVLLRAAARVPGIAALLVLGATMGWAQIVDTGTIAGVVKDASGAVVAGAPVTLRNTGTGLETKTVADSQGLYVSPPLTVGNYDVEVAVAGFDKVVAHVRLEVAQRPEVDVSLVPGKTTQTVSVEATAALLNVETSTLSNLRTETAVKNLPLNGRNFAELVGLTAGVMPAQSQLIGSVALSQVRGETGYSVNGLRLEENHYLLDGISDSENHNGLGIILFPPLDAVEEFREETSVPDARFGRGGGGTINLIFKSGTDQFHGDAFEFLRNSDLDARNFFDKNLPGFKMNQFGGTIGGPLGRRKDPKTFFFADYQGTRTRQGLTYVNTVPTAAFRQGNFSAASQTIYDPLTQVELANGTYARTPFAGNLIPAGRIDTVGQNIENLYPLPNLSGLANNFLFNPIRWTSENEFDGRVDHWFTGKDSGFVRYSHAGDLIYQPGTLPAPTVGGVISGLTHQPSNQLVLSETHLLSPTTINTARFGWSRVAINTTDANAGVALATQVGISGSNIPGDAPTDGLPIISITGATTWGSAGNLPSLIVSNNYQYDDDVTLVRGRHTLDIGGELARLQYNIFQTNELRGSMTFTTAYSSNPAASAGTGIGFADVLLGKPISGLLQFLDGDRGLRQSHPAAFIEDTLKATSKLTFNLGLRYENYLGWPWAEVDHRAYVFTPPGGVTQAGTDGVPASGVHANNFNFMPRVGFAYRARSSTVFRAAYGIFYSAPQIALQNTPAGNPPDFIDTAFTNSQYNFPAAQPASAGFSHVGTVLGSALNALQPYTPMPYTQQWNAAIEHQISASTLLTVAYVGTGGTHLLGAININQPVPGTSAIVDRRPFPLFQSVTDYENVDSSRYNALQATLERRFARHVSFQLAYTYSHALDYGSADSAAIEDSYNLRLDRANADFNVPQHFVGSTTYELPFKASGLLGQAVQGWQVNGILNLFDGIPFSVQSATNTLNIGATSRAELVGTANGALPPGRRSVAEWFNTAAFTTPPALQWGDADRNSLQGPATKNLDLSLFKNFRLNQDGSRSLQFRSEFFNFFNTPQFNNPLSTIGAAGAGTLTSAGSPYTFQRLSREIQFALKLYF